MVRSSRGVSLPPPLIHIIMHNDITINSKGVGGEGIEGFFYLILTLPIRNIKKCLIFFS